MIKELEIELKWHKSLRDLCKEYEGKFLKKLSKSVQNHFLLLIKGAEKEGVEITSNQLWVFNKKHTPVISPEHLEEQIERIEEELRTIKNLLSYPDLLSFIDNMKEAMRLQTKLQLDCRPFSRFFPTINGGKKYSIEDLEKEMREVDRLKCINSLDKDLRANLVYCQIKKAGGIKRSTLLRNLWEETDSKRLDEAISFLKKEGKVEEVVDRESGVYYYYQGKE